MVLRDYGDTDCTTFVDLLTSGDLDLGRKVTKLFYALPDISSTIRANLKWFRLLVSEEFAPTDLDPDRHTRTHTHTHTHTDAFSVLR